MNPKVSVVVPVFNTENFLEDCLESLISQSLAELEIIIVNDGSTDNSNKIITNYTKLYPDKIITLYQEHNGNGPARNIGIEHAKGEYIGFVDSDDWVEDTMFETLYNAALNGHHDIVICDCRYVYPDNSNFISRGFTGSSFNKHQAILYSTNPAFCVNKLYKKELFNHVKFSNKWYEDVATTPLLLTFANSPTYIHIPLYNYRQRQNSITSSNTKETLGILDAWERLLNAANPFYKDEIVFSVANSISIFIDFKPLYTGHFLEFARKNRQLITSNKYYNEALKNKRIKDLYNLPPIPPIIHYCWFGDNEKPHLIKKCIKTWKEKLPNYQIIEWNETNCDIHENQFVKEAYGAKKWAFVADYFRMKVLYEHGGIYLDTDIEITKNIDIFRHQKAFLSYEIPEVVQTGIIGCIKGTSLIKKILDTYKEEKFIKRDGTYNMVPNVERVTSILVEEYNLILNGEKQILRDGVVVYPANILTLDANDGKNYAIHHFDASWWDNKNWRPWKDVIIERYKKAAEDNYSDEMYMRKDKKSKRKLQSSKSFTFKSVFKK